MRKMKKLLLLFSFIIAAGCSRAQTPDAASAAIVSHHILAGAAIVPYRILKTDSTFATPANLQHHKTMVVYFAPDCPHCQHLTVEMKQKMKQFGDTQIVMITWSNNFDIRAIKNFVRDYDLKKYPNIIVGTEGYTYTVQKYFNIETTPYIAIYNSDKKLVKGFAKAPDIDVLIKTLKNADLKKKG